MPLRRLRAATGRRKRPMVDTRCDRCHVENWSFQATNAKGEGRRNECDGKSPDNKVVEWGQHESEQEREARGTAGDRTRGSDPRSDVRTQELTRDGNRNTGGSPDETFARTLGVRGMNATNEEHDMNSRRTPGGLARLAGWCYDHRRSRRHRLDRHRGGRDRACPAPSAAPSATTSPRATRPRSGPSTCWRSGSRPRPATAPTS